MNAYSEARSDVVDHLVGHLVGPIGGSDESVTDPPNRLYATGVLYPRKAMASDVFDEEEPDFEGDVAEPGSEVDDPVRMASEWLPSSLGMTFLLGRDEELVCEVWGASYPLAGSKPRAWQRLSLATEEDPDRHSITKPESSSKSPSLAVLDGAALLDSTWRSVSGGHLVTVTLVNVLESDEKPAAEDCLYQVGLRCRPTQGSITRYPSVEFLSSDLEEEELRLRYRHRGVFAVGHGTSAAWSEVVDNCVSWVETKAVPQHEVRAITQTAEDDFRALRLSYLATVEDEPESVVEAIAELFDSYENWATRLRQIDDIPRSLKPAALRILSRIDESSERMRRGLELLARDPDVRRSFRLATLAMLIQMHHGRGHPPLADESEYLKLDYSWYPFQLAFQLMTLESVVDPSSDERQIVDLLWFPTGGGKTEAYLAIAAIAMFHRRLTGRGEGTTVITRYTLRLLTAQQFQRSAGLICAVEWLRGHRDDLGSEPFSIGLWVGNEATPETLDAAAEIAEEVVNDLKPSNPFPLLSCPWCGAGIVPDKHTDDLRRYGFEFGPGLFRFRCPNTQCAYSDRLPVSIVDEDLYANPPSFLLATVDKFARLAWLATPTAFFGSDDIPPPDLIIQDELHLLSGPLGTTVALYEHAIEGVIKMREGLPKVIASTATIRRADDQTRALYGREVRVFPPSGINEDDSYFARTDYERPGRLYVGVMSQSHTVATSIVHIASSLLQATEEISMPLDMRSAYWTLVAYNNSLRELGRALTLARDDIPARIRAIALDEDHMRLIDDPDVVELTGHLNASELPEILGRLDLGPENSEAVSFLATTNMLSVGVDIPRLALMLINGQPKTTAEYIQASSRVGRSQIPGLVVTLYSATKPRDRSHYEGFVGYHASLYRFVEPTSVTPFSNSSRTRALHAALVILVRHGLGLDENGDAHDLDPMDPAFQRIKEYLVEIVTRVDPYEADATAAHLDRIVDDWLVTREEAIGEGKRLGYKASGRQSYRLLKNFGEGGPLWETLHSMRNVDRNSPIHVLGEDRSGGRSRS